MSWLHDEYLWMLQEAYDRAFTPVEPVSNTFLANPVPREGFIDDRRDDGCVPVITGLAIVL